jgi:hypothetical protein
MISTRFAPVVFVLLACALVPVVMHSYVGASRSDGRRLHEIPTTLDGLNGVPTSRNPSWAKGPFDSDEWWERTYGLGADSVVLTVIRSYDVKSVYHHPELAIARGTPFVSHETVGAAPDRPLHVLRTRDRRTIAVYALHYDDRFVENPIRFQLRTAGELLIGPRRPMTLFFALQRMAGETSDVTTEAAGRVLFAAIDEFLAQRGSADGAGR